MYPFCTPLVIGDELIGWGHFLDSLLGLVGLNVCISVFHTDGVSHSGGALGLGDRGIESEDCLGGMSAGVGDESSYVSLSECLIVRSCEGVIVRELAERGVR